MTFDTINENRIKIDLTDDEIYLLFGSYDKINYDDERSKHTLNLLFKKAVPFSEHPLECEKLLIEVVPSSKGCSIFFTKINGNTKKRYRRVKSHSYLLSFDKSEDMIRGILNLNRDKSFSFTKSELYSKSDGYSVILHTANDIEGKLLGISEYGTVSKQPEEIAKAEEYGKLVCDRLAIKQITDNFKEL